MSAKVDERTVRMQFDNQQFEAKAQNTITTLGALTKALQLPFGNTKGLDQIQTAASRLDFSKLNVAVDMVQQRFSLLGMMGVEAMNRIASAAVSMGQKLVESVTVEPLKAGFSEYETKMDSVKRILNSAKNEDGTAVSLAQVNQRLDELNTYADKTIYNFMDMTENIGKFTNAGVDLDKSVLAIQGIANEAALAGAGTQEASRAMYNFAQALSAGSVKLIDWKSIENANMATVSFKEELIKTALELGTVKKQGDEYVTTTTGLGKKTSEAFTATTKFNESLSYQWMTSDVLIQTLAKYADETTDLGKAAFQAATEVTTFSKLIDTLKEALGSGWTETWQLIFGDFNEAKALWTDVNNVLSDFINSTADARNGALEMWKEFGGRTSLITGLSEAWAGLSKILSTIGEAFMAIFPSIDFRDLLKVSSTVRELGKAFHNFAVDNELPIYRISRAIFSAFDLIGQVVSAVYRTISPIFGVIGELFGLFGSKAADASVDFTYFVIGLKQADTIYNTLQRFVDVLKKVASTIFDVAKAILDFFGIHIEVEEGASFVETITAVFEAFSQNPMVQSGIDVLTNAKNAIVDFVTGIQGSKVIQNVAGALTWLGNALATLGGAIKDNAINLFGQLGTELKNFFTTEDGQKIDFEHVLDVGVVGLIFKKLYDILTGNNSPIKAIKDFFDNVSNIQDLLDSAAEAFSDFTETLLGPLKALQESIKADTLLKIAKAIAILAASVWVLSRIDAGKMGVALFGIGSLMGELAGVMAIMSKLMSNLDAGKLTAIGPSLIALSIAVGILSLAVAGLSKLDEQSLMLGVEAVGALMAAMVAMTRFGGKNISTKGMIGMSVAILILQASVKRLGEMDEHALALGLEAVIALMAGLTLLSKFGSKNFSGIGMIAVAAAVLILQKVVKSLGEMDEKAVNQGVTAVSVLLIFLGLFSLVSGKRALTASLGAVALAFAVGMIQKVIAEFGAMDTNALGNGLFALAASLAAMVLALNAMTGTLAGAAALYVATTAVKRLVPVMIALSEVPFNDILKAVAGLALVFGVLIVAGTNLAPLVIVFQGFAAAIALTGLGLLALGAGLFAIGAGVTALSVSLVAGVGSIITSIGLIVAAILGAIPLVAVAIGRGIIAILQVIGDSAETIVNTVVQIGLAIIKGLEAIIPPWTEFLYNMFMFTIQFLTEKVPPLADALVTMVVTLIDGVAMAIYNNTDRIMAAIHHVVGALIDFILAALQELLAQVPGVGGKISTAIQGVRDELGKTMNSEEGRKFGADFVDGVKDGVESGKEGAGTAGEDVGKSTTSGLLAGLGGMPTDVSDITSMLPESLSGVSGDFNAASFALGEGGADALIEGFGDLSESGLNVDQGLANGMLDNQDLVNSAAEALGLDSVDALNMGLGVSSPSTKTWETGLYADQGLANGITENQEVVRTAVAGLGTVILEEFDTFSEPVTAEGSAVASAYASGISESTAATASSEIASSAIEALASVIPEFSQNGINSGEAYAVGIGSTVPKTRGSGLRISRSAITGIDTLRQEFTKKGSAAGDNYSSGIRSKLASAESAGKAIAKAAADGATNVDGFYKAGSDSGQGYIDGIKSKAKAMAEASAQAAADALQAAKDAIESASPSKAYFRLGEDSDEGYILGAQSKAASMKATMAQLAKGSMAAFYDGIYRANLAANDELVVVPTVAPVMDMNNVYGGVDFLRTIFNGTGEVLGNITAEVGNNVADIRELKQSTRQILKALNNRKPITLDGKTVIGWVDAELGAL